MAASGEHRSTGTPGRRGDLTGDPAAGPVLLSNRLARQGGRRIPEAVLERDYCLSWILVGLSHSPLQGRLALKGGTALKKCYFGDYRFSEDLDFTLIQETSWEEIERGLAVAFAATYRQSGIGIRLDRLDRHSHENSHTLYLAYEGPLPGGPEERQDRHHDS